MKHLLLGSFILTALAAPAVAERERITWNHRDGTQVVTFYDAGSNYTSFMRYSFGTSWRLVGVAGNRILWQEQVNAHNATLWRISDTGNYESHVVLSPPATGYKARSLALALPNASACFRTQDDQAYWVLWESDTPNTAIYVQLVRGDGLTVEPIRRITKPAAMGSRAAIALTPIHGGDLVVLFAQDSQRSSIWTISRSNMAFAGEWLLLANPVQRTAGRFLYPASLNAHYDSTEGAMLQILFNDVAAGPYGGAAMIVNAQERFSSPFGRFTITRELWTHVSSSGSDTYATGDSHEATSHTIQPSVCP